MDAGNERESTAPKRRESRAGTRKVTSLTAEQLDGKRANDREAQRTIRQRTKEHIESLEREVAELRAKTERFDEVVQRNAALDEEVRRLRHQLAIVTSSPAYPGNDSNVPHMAMFPSNYSGPFGGATDSISGASSVLHSPHDQIPPSQQRWQNYSSPSPAAMGQSPKPDYPGSVEPYILHGQLQPPAMHQPVSPMPYSPDQHVGFNPDSGPVPLSDPSSQPFNLQYYQVPHDFSQRPGDTLQRNLSHGTQYGSPQHSPSAPLENAAPSTFPWTIPGRGIINSQVLPRTHRHTGNRIILVSGRSQIETPNPKPRLRVACSPYPVMGDGV
ncbi:hypothetical protein MPDQ_001405 [Monascus purpureus]|uniref:BZIP domain-containing protein n=1 Tax=Monascus purpureus TaxID=5098 RepID=A0A507QRK2_MONPU|nr:hypothetical protein MPDQ_001405 [Monascus purpureus]BDD57288.1 hypothetical protein MAP00_002663 [Monascus purpureus]